MIYEDLSISELAKLISPSSEASLELKRRGVLRTKNIVGENVIPPYLSMGGEDFSYFSNVVPGCFFFLGSSPKDRPAMTTPQHCSHFDIDEDAMLIGSSIFVELALNN